MSQAEIKVMLSRRKVLFFTATGSWFTSQPQNWEYNRPEMQKVNTFTRAVFFRIQKFTPKVRDSRQIQCYQKCVIRDISKPNRLENSVKHQETVKNTRKQCETEWNSHRQRHLWFPAVVINTLHSFTPPFTKFSTRIFTPVGKSLHEHRSHLFASLAHICLL